MRLATEAGRKLITSGRSQQSEPRSNPLTVAFSRQWPVILHRAASLRCARCIGEGPWVQRSLRVLDQPQPFHRPIEMSSASLQGRVKDARRCIRLFTAPRSASTLFRAFADGGIIFPLHRCQAAVAQACGFADWNGLMKDLPGAPPKFGDQARRCVLAPQLIPWKILAVRKQSRAHLYAVARPKPAFGRPKDLLGWITIKDGQDVPSTGTAYVEYLLGAFDNRLGTFAFEQVFKIIVVPVTASNRGWNARSICPPRGNGSEIAFLYETQLSDEFSPAPPITLM